MKLSYRHIGAILAVILGLSGCGGKESFTVSGTISGLSDNGLVLTNNGDTVSPKMGDTTFTFPKSIDYGVDYNIVVNQPLRMNCSVSGGSGSAGHFTSISASVVCTRKSYSVGGKIGGLGVGKTLTLTNGNTGDKITLTGTAAASLDFKFALNVDDGKPYNVVVVPPQPSGQTCVVSNAAGTMDIAPVTNVVVTCS